MSQRVLLTDSDWAAIDGKVCLVTKFVPMATLHDGKVKAISSTTPYAGVNLIAEDGQELEGFIGHKLDFQLLWAAFNERTEVEGARLDFRAGTDATDVIRDGLGENEEVWLMWTKKNYRTMLPFKRLLPRLVVMVSPKGGHDLLLNHHLRPELTGQARFRASSPLVKWTPTVMNL